MLKLLVSERLRDRLNRRSDGAADVLIEFSLPPVDEQAACIRAESDVDAIGAVDCHIAVSFKSHLGDDLRRVEQPFGEEVEDELARLAVAVGRPVRPLEKVVSFLAEHLVAFHKLVCQELAIQRLELVHLVSRQAEVDDVQRDGVDQLGHHRLALAKAGIVQPQRQATTFGLHRVPDATEVIGEPGQIAPQRLNRGPKRF